VIRWDKLRRSLIILSRLFPERQSLSAHQAAKPRQR
jgi:hypothetical protein